MWNNSISTKGVKKILDEVDLVLNQEQNDDLNCISLFDCLNLIKNVEASYTNMSKEFRSKIESLNDKKSYLINFMIGFDYEKNCLILYNDNYMNKFDISLFGKKNDNLYIVESDDFYQKEILRAFGTVLSNLYDELFKYKDYYCQNNYGIKTINSNFLVDISHFGVNIYSKSFLKFLPKDFFLSSSNYIDGYRYRCNSSEISNYLKGREDEFFKKIFVRIDDCPKWTRDELLKIRHEQISSKSDEQSGINKKLIIKK